MASNDRLMTDKEKEDADEAEKEKKGPFFNWFYVSINIGALVAASVIVWIQVNADWELGFAIQAAATVIVVVFIFTGTRLFWQQKPGCSPLTRIFQVVVASLRKRKVDVPDDKSLLYEVEADSESAVVGNRKLDHTSGLSFLDKAAVVEGCDDGKDTVNPWRLCTVTQVEEVKAILLLLPVWATGIIFSTVCSQMNNYVLRPPSVLFWFPVYFLLIVPIASKITGIRRGVTQLQPMGVGLFISIFFVFFAGVLELVRLRIVQKHNYYGKEDIIPISVLWQVPQYFIIGCAEVFMFIGQLEFFYVEAPDATSACPALLLLTDAFGQYVSSLLVTIVTKITTRNGSPGWLPDNLNIGKLHYFFWLLSVLSVINFVAFLGVAKFYKYKRTLGTLH
ncbi:hypothetical protein K1719_019867 [Acacia pycnantha]|nr:hypothetical protein K1719_019867 [Acacia pycnantha]